MVCTTSAIANRYELIWVPDSLGWDEELDESRGGMCVGTLPSLEDCALAIQGITMEMRCLYGPGMVVVTNHRHQRVSVPEACLN